MPLRVRRTPRVVHRFRLLLLVLVATTLTACVDDALLVQPAERPGASVPIALSLAGAMGGAPEAFDAADQLHVLVIGFDDAGLSSVLENETIALTASGGDVAASVPVTFDPARDSVQVVVTLLYQGSPLFMGSAYTTLIEGAHRALTIAPTPVVNAVAVSTPVATIEAVGDTFRVTGAALFATGDTIVGPSLAWQSSDETVATVDATGLVTGVARGSATITATVDGVTSTPAAVTVASVSQGPKSMAAGYMTTCGLTSTGAAYCWGADMFGALGNGGAYGSSAPVAVDGGHSFRSISGAWARMCALDAAGAAWCWGENRYGELGTGDLGIRFAPTPVTGGITFTDLDTGWGQTCGLDPAGSAWCWGRNDIGQLGTSSPVGESCNGYPCSMTPLQVDGGLSFTKISTGIMYACGVTAAGVAYCWGHNSDGQLGDGTTTDRATPTPVNTALRFVEIETGVWQTCGLTAAGEAYCWGMNTGGILGIGSTVEAPQLTPQLVIGGHTFRDIALESDNNIIGHACGITTANQLYCWGWNTFGQLGSAAASETCTFASGFTASCASAPVPVDGATDIASVTVGIEYTCGVTITTEEAYCAGANFSGQLGDGTLVDRSTPTLLADPLGDPMPTTVIATPATQTMAAPGQEVPMRVEIYDQNGYQMPGYEITYSDSTVLATIATFRDTVVVVGADGGAATVTVGLGPATQTVSFTVNPPPPVQDAFNIAIGISASCGVDTSGQAWCWGQNSPAKLGVGTNDLNPHPTPVAVQQGAETFVSMTSGGGHTCALTADGRAFCWGNNNNGQTGNTTGETCEPQWAPGTTVACVTTPVQVNTYHRFVRLGAGHDNTCGQTALGPVLCWGANYAGQAGIGSTFFVGDEPSYVQTGLTFTAFDGSSMHMCALAQDGSAHCWGSNLNGQIGNGAVGGDVTTPQPVVGGHTFTDIAAGGRGYNGVSHSCAIDTAGQAWCWGVNDVGQLGLNELTTTESGTPLQVQQGALVFTQITASWEQTCALASDGTPYCWGATAQGQFLVPTQMSTTAFDYIDMTGHQFCATTAAGAGYCWGSNDVGQLGDGTTTNTPTPVAVTGGITFR
ncbi:MAG TPA: Ig-like domain-containing protein [Longimicrobiales bacterium]